MPFLGLSRQWDLRFARSIGWAWSHFEPFFIIYPNGDPVFGQAPFRIDIKALNADTTMLIDCAWELQDSQVILIVGSHTRQDLARIALDDAETVHPLSLKFDQIADVNEPVMMAVKRLIGWWFPILV